jgi:DNA-binding MarR family transcriptional regulator
LSKHTREELIAQLADGIRAMQIESDLFDEAVCARLGVNRTDHRLLDVLEREGPMTAGRLAEINDLSPAATTVAIDRLERAGYARRRRDPDDRRRVVVEITPTARRRAETIYAPLAAASAHAFARYPVRDLEAVARFLTDATAITAEQRGRLAQP